MEYFNIINTVLLIFVIVSLGRIDKVLIAHKHPVGIAYQEENDALTTMLRDERRAVRDLQQKVATLESEARDTLAENKGLAADLENAQDEIIKLKRKLIISRGNNL